MDLNGMANSLAKGITQFGNYAKEAAGAANGVSSAAQSAQGTFNQTSANIANNINANNLASQYAFNSAQAADANNFTMMMWDKAASWNEAMWEKMAEFNHNEAQLNRDWQTQMANTAYQRAIKDMKAAGLNPALAMGGISSNVPSGGAATVSAAQMGGASGSMASGGLLNAHQASESSYTGQMEYLSGMLGLLSAAISGISTATSAMGGMGKFGEAIGDALTNILKSPEEASNVLKEGQKEFTDKSERRKTEKNEKYYHNAQYTPFYNPDMNKPY